MSVCFYTVIFAWYELQCLNLRSQSIILDLWLVLLENRRSPDNAHALHILAELRRDILLGRALCMIRYKCLFELFEDALCFYGLGVSTDERQDPLRDGANGDRAVAGLDADGGADRVQ